MRDRFDRDDAIAFGFFTLIKFLRWFTVAYRKIGGLHIRPCKEAIAILGIAFVFLLAVGRVNATHTTAIRHIVANVFKSFNFTRLQENHRG